MRDEVLGVILAGGNSIRFGSDKASAMLGGKILLQHVIERAAPQVDKLLINGHRDTAGTLSVDYSPLPDAFPGEGPLAGVLAGLEYANMEGFPLVATFACDTPFFPHEMVTPLRAGLVESDANVCVAKCGQDEHYTFALWKTSCVPVLLNAFTDGPRSLRGAADLVGRVTSEFPSAGEGPDGNVFFNINTLSDLASAEEWMGHR